MNKLLLITLFVIPVTGFCAGTPVNDADNAVIALKNQQLLKEQLLELKLIRQELQNLKIREGDKETCRYASKSYTDGKQIKDVPLMADKVCEKGKWVTKGEGE
ncbi:hypothetical protein [Serratia ficaria]|uniref:hypothetical protein n=1 Tax=Serratia ficaria TaxID=61651 RepID=UPI0021B84792|nr:hypothetical protein [Serratia ficaria]